MSLPRLGMTVDDFHRWYPTYGYWVAEDIRFGSYIIQVEDAELIGSEGSTDAISPDCTSN